MASKSRLGKGLGALFPALPGNVREDETLNAVDNAKQVTSTEGEPEKAVVSRETTIKRKTEGARDFGKGAAGKAPMKPVRDARHVGSAAGSLKSPTVTNTVDSDNDSFAMGGGNASNHDPVVRGLRNNADIAGKASDQSSEEEMATAKSGTVASNKPHNGEGKGKSVKSGPSSRQNVSRETTLKSKQRRKSIPSIETLKHPSDVFFGTTGRASSRSNVTGIKEASTTVETSSAPMMIDVGIGRKGAGATKGDAGRLQSVDAGQTNPSKSDGIRADEALKPVQGGYLAELELDQIGPNLHQPRAIFDEDDLRELADSLREVGVLQPVVVRRRPIAKQASVIARNQENVEGLDSEYELIMGERRWRAAHLAGLKTIPAIVKTTSDDDMLRDALLENLHRVALNPLEEAAAYQQMMDDFGLTQEQLSHSVSKSRSQIANTLRLLNLPPSVQKKVSAGVLSAGHARALLGLQTAEDMEKLAKRILQEGLSVRSTEEMVAMKTNSGQVDKKHPVKRNDSWSQSPITRRLENRFDTKVTIKGSKKHGRIEIVFSSPEDMDRIVNLLAPEQDSASHWV